MGVRSLIEFNHDRLPLDADLLEWAKSIRVALGSGSPDLLPDGTELVWFRHSSQPCPVRGPAEAPSSYELNRIRKNVIAGGGKVTKNAIRDVIAAMCKLKLWKLVRPDEGAPK